MSTSLKRGLSKLPLDVARYNVDEIAKKLTENGFPVPRNALDPPPQKASSPALAEPTDLSTWIDDPLIEPERPDVGSIVGGGALFYRGRLNEIHGEPGIGKSNVNLVVSLDVLNRGGRVVYIDPEDTPRSIVLRLLSFGADPESIRERFHYFHNPEPGDFPGIIAFADQHRPDFVVIDGLAEIIAAHGFSEDKSGDALAILRDVARPFTESGAAVVVSDHVTKSAEGRGRHPRGSGAKLGRYDGAVYEIKLGKGYGPGRDGFLTLTVCKDRNGGVGPIGKKVAEVAFCPEDDTSSQPRPGGGTRSGIPQTRVGVVRPKFEDVGPSDGPWRPTAIMEKVSQWLESNPGISKAALRRSIGGKASYVDKAIRCLVEDGHIVERPSRCGKTAQLEFVTAYPPENPAPRPTSSQPRPNLVPQERDEVSDTSSHLVPPLTRGDKGRGRTSPEDAHDGTGNSSNIDPGTKGLDS